MAINDRVKILMEEENLTSSEFADKTGIQQSTFSHFLNGRNKASLDVVTKIQETFDVEFNWLIYGQGNMRRPKTPANGLSMSEIGHPLGVKNNNNTDIQYSRGASMESLEAIAPILSQHAQSQSEKIINKAPRKITEIRVFFDDNTYEIFKAEK